jgi:CRISPR-associated endonuclease Cas1
MRSRLTHRRRPGTVTQTEAVPDLIPARMLNEFTFCKRLFFLQWVDRLWAPNADTEEGDYHHRRVDSGGGAATKYREELASVRLIDVLHLSVFGNVQITAQAMRTLFDTGIGVFHFTYGGWLSGVSSGLPAKNVNLRIRQSAAALRRDLSAPRRMIAGKIRNGRVFLRRNSGDSSSRTVAQMAALAAQAEQVTDPATLLGIEGTAARLYFGAFPSMLRDASALPGPLFTGLRNRRPPVDAVNCLLRSPTRC